MNFNYLLGIIILTIILTRVYLWFHQVHAPMIAGFQLHHYMYGLVLIAVYFIFANPTILAIGLGLLIDELPLFFIYKGFNWPDNHWGEYFSWKSVIGIIVILLIMVMIWFGLYKNKNS